MSTPDTANAPTPRTEAMFHEYCETALLFQLKLSVRTLETELAAEKAEVASLEASNERLFARSQLLSQDLLKVTAERDALRNEANEQARLLGISGERELRVMAENATLRHQLAEAGATQEHVDCIKERDQWRKVADGFAAELLRYREITDAEDFDLIGERLAAYNALKGETK